MNGYHKRTYRRIGDIFDDFRFMMRNRQRIRAAMRLIDPAFRERLMLVVTEVNGCRYCAYHHARVALSEGLSQEDIDALLRGTVEHCPPEQAVAMLYAQHWAETEGVPDQAARAKVLETYGEEKTQAMELFLRMITMGNHMGNTFDYFLYRISGGRLMRR